MKLFKFMALLLITAGLLLLGACGRKETEEPMEADAQWDTESIEAECLEAAEVCKDLVIRGGQDIRENMEQRLTEAGYMVVDRQDPYPSYLANPGDLYAFLAAESQGKNAGICFFQVSEEGELNCSVLRAQQGVRGFYYAQVAWDEKKEPFIQEQYELPVYDWKLTESGSFFYQVHRPDIHGADYSQLRLEPANQVYNDLARRYILPVDYIQNNMFFTDWSETDLGELCLPDIIDLLYAQKYGEPFPKYEYAYLPEECYYQIPQAVFEEIILSFFRVSPEQIRNSAVADGSGICYPYSGMHLDYSKAPDLTPVVADAVWGNDGTITMTVYVESKELSTDCLFSHVLTVRPLDGDGFQYVSNRILSVPEEGLPVPESRLSYNKRTQGMFEIHIGG